MTVSVVKLGCAAKVDLFVLCVGYDDETSIWRPQCFIYRCERFRTQDSSAGHTVGCAADKLQGGSVDHVAWVGDDGIEIIQLSIRGNEGVIGNFSRVGVEIAEEGGGDGACVRIHPPKTGVELAVSGAGSLK